MRLKATAKRLVPDSVQAYLRRRRVTKMRRRNAARSATDVFTEVYDSGYWGGDPYSSGSGSRGQAATEYAQLVSQLIVEFDLRRVVDVGCGDFHVASQFIAETDTYIGLDVASNIILRNQPNTVPGRVEFAELDATKEELPSGDICLIRQVLQHLSNAQIEAILENAQRFPMVVVTEHWPSTASQRFANLDKPHGPDIRFDLDSWVDLGATPFSLPVEEVLRVTTASEDGTPESIRTFIWQPQPRAKFDLSGVKRRIPVDDVASGTS